jgi:hypothetical protein
VRTLLWALLVGLALLWSLLAWAMHSLAGAGGAAVVTVSRWLQLEPSQTQWLADGFDLAGGAAQWLVVGVWLIGMALIAVLGWLGAQAGDGAMKMSREIAEGRRTSLDSVIEGEVRERTVAPRPGDPS